MNPEPSRRPIRVLVVDDQRRNLEIAERVLVRSGYVVKTATNGADALQLHEADGPFDGYVLDVMMPGMRGTELARHIKATHRNAKILYYTAYDSYLFERSPVLPENEAFVQKPVSTRDLAEAISLLLFGHTRGPEPSD
jgi:CheY-like chemotaxis protein